MMDEGEVLMKQGDVLVQRGTHHSWANRSDKMCRMAFILIDADRSIEPPPGHFADTRSVINRGGEP